jgi:hypothetical protein
MNQASVSSADHGGEKRRSVSGRVPCPRRLAPRSRAAHAGARLRSAEVRVLRPDSFSSRLRSLVLHYAAREVRLVEKFRELGAVYRERRASSPICRCISSFPPPFRLRSWTELSNSSARGAARGSCHAWGDARADRARACVDYYARFAGARCCYQSHTMRALWTVADLTNALQVKLRVAARSPDISRPVGDADDVAAMSGLDVRVDNGPGRREAACRQLRTWRYRNSRSKSC